MDTPTTIYPPSSLPFPFKIHRFLLPSSSTSASASGHRPSIEKTTPLFSYSYQPSQRKQDKEIPARQAKVYESPVSGELIEWKIEEGQEILDASSPILLIQEPCTHAVQFAGQCAICGKDLSVVDYTGFSDTSRANVRMAHEHGELTVSREKLSLIVDLDQTIIHATVDRSVQDWLDNPSHPNFKALEGTQRFQLRSISGEIDDPYWYYVKPRPGLKEFLTSVSEMYEMHVYTMGTRAYASEVCNVIDPDGAFFGGRILSRDESGSMTRKSLQRLFPCDTSMVVIIDDRADVWDRSPNLVKVIPYEFFVGIGDINAAFLPKRKDIVIPAPTSSSASSSAPTSSSFPIDTSLDLQVSDPSLSHTSSMSTSPLVLPSDSLQLSDTADIALSLSEAAASTALTLQDQSDNRPLSHNKIHHPHTHHPLAPNPTLSIEGGAAGLADEDDSFVDLEAALQHADGDFLDEDEGEAVLRDDDRELERVFSILKDVHGAFYDRIDPKEGDVKEIIPEMKRAVLRDVNILFSGLIALNEKPEDSEFWQMARTFGARCMTEVHSGITHVAATQLGTAKVYAAQKIRGVHVVWAKWLIDTAATWCRQAESNYYLENDNGPPPLLRFPLHSSPIFISNPRYDRSTDSATIGGGGAGGTNARNGFERDEDDDEDEDDNIGLAAIDWADADKELEDFLNETDGDEIEGDGGDEEEDDESDFDRPSSRKRIRVATDSEDDTKESAQDKGKGRATKPEEKTTVVAAAGSALSKRIKKSRSRKSRLKVSFPAPSDEIEGEEVPASTATATMSHGSTSRRQLASPRPSLAAAATSVAVGDDGASQASSDDEAFFAQMAAEVESGWS